LKHPDSNRKREEKAAANERGKGKLRREKDKGTMRGSPTRETAREEGGPPSTTQPRERRTVRSAKRRENQSPYRRPHRARRKKKDEERRTCLAALAKWLADPHDEQKTILSQQGRKGGKVYRRSIVRRADHLSGIREKGGKLLL